MSGERMVATLRVAVTLSIVAMVALGERSVRPYPAAAWAVAVANVAYGAAAYQVVRSFSRRSTAEPPHLAWGLTLADSLAVLAIVIPTGAGESLFIPVLILEAIAVAIRFNVRRAILVAAGLGTALAVIIAAVPRPELSGGHRLQSAVWWAWLLVATSLLVGFLSRIAEEAWAGRARAEEEANAEHRRLTAERSMRQRLEVLEDSRRDFLQAVAHDFRTPIASVEALSRALARQPELDTGQRLEMLEIIESHARHLGSVLVSVREVALADSMGPDRNLALSDVNFAEMVRDATSAAGLTPDRVTADIDPVVAIIRTDADKMQRVLTNVVENAGRHSPAHERIDVSLRATGGVVVLEVADRGPGMPPEVANKAFDKFFGFGEARGSSGLGMWIVAQLSAALGGAVSASPRPGGGLIVTMTQPFIQPAHRGM